MLELLEFDFCEVLNDIDSDRIEREVNKMSQVQLENAFDINIEIKKIGNDLEKKEAEIYIECIENRMLEIPSNELICI